MIHDEIGPVRPAGLTAARFARALAVGGGDALIAAAFAASQPGWSDRDKIALALRSAVDAADADDLADAMAPIGTDLLRATLPASALGRLLGVLKVPPRVKALDPLGASATAFWVGEGAPAPVSALSIDGSVTIIPKRLTALAVVVAETLKVGGPLVDELVRRALIHAAVRALDLATCDPSSDASTARPASLLHGAQPIPSSGSTAADIAHDLGAALQAAIAGGGDTGSLLWIMSPRTLAHIAALRVGDVAAFPGALGGRVLDLPVVATLGMPIESATSARTSIGLIDGSGVALATDGVDLAVATHASIELDSAPTSGERALASFWRDGLTGFRVTHHVGWQAVRSGARAVISDVTY